MSANKTATIPYSGLSLFTWNTTVYFAYSDSMYLLPPTWCGHIEFGSITKRCYDSDAFPNCCSTTIFSFTFNTELLCACVRLYVREYLLRLCDGDEAFELITISFQLPYGYRMSLILLCGHFRSTT